MAYKKIQFKRGTKTGMPVLRSGEPGFTQDEKSLYIGDGTANQRFLNETQTNTRIDEKIAPVTQSITNNVATLNQTITNNIATLNQSIASNIATVNQAITDKVKVNDVTANVNFIEKKIVQDGLVFAKTTLNPTNSISIPTISQSEFYVHFNIVKPTSSSLFYTLTLSRYNIGVQISSNGKFYIVNTENGSIKASSLYTYDTSISHDVVFYRNSNSCFLITQKEVIACINDNEKYVADNGLLNSNYCYVYTKKLSLQEIQHNLSVLNNSKSINRINDYAISTDTDHIEDRTGRVQDTINRVFYKQNCKEFTSSGEAITVNNGMDGYVLSGKIEGQTVKCIYSKTGSFQGISSTYFLLSQYTQPSANNYIVLDIESIDAQGVASPVFMVRGYDKDNQFYEICRTSNLKTGLNVIKFTDDTKSLKSFFITSVMTYSKTPTCVIKGVNIIEGNNATSVTSIIPFGLSSTQATISNLGLKYSFYMPTIDGKTRVMKATKGTQNWVEIAPDEVRNTITYDYKLVNNGDLGSTPTTYDYIDRARKVKVVNTKEVTLGELTSCSIEAWSGAKRFKFNTTLFSDGKLQSGSSDIRGISTIVPIDISDKLNILTDYMRITVGQIYYNVPVTDSRTTTDILNLVKSGVVRYQLATPIEVPMTDAELSAYDAYRKVIETGGVSGVYDTFGIKEDGSGVYTQNTIEEVYDGSTDEEIYFETTNANTTLFAIYPKIKPSNKTNGGKIVCDKLPTESYEIFSEDVVCVGITANSNFLRIRQLNSLLVTLDAPSLRTILKASPITVRYKLATPIVTTIPKELVPAILTQATNEFKFGEGVMATKATISAPVNRISEMQTQINEIKALITTPSNINLTMNYVEDEYNKNQSIEGVV